VGRLFHEHAAAKLTTAQIWDAVHANQIKLPATISIDREGSVFLTPHQVNYTLNPRLPRESFERLVSGEAGRRFLDKAQIRHEASPLTVPPRSGILTSCSMYLKEHYVVLNQGPGNFGIHTSAVLLDPVKTFGTNIMLEIYNSGSQPVVSPRVSVEVFQAPDAGDPRFKTLQKTRTRLLSTAQSIYECLDSRPVRNGAEPTPKTRITVSGQSATMENRSLFLTIGSRDGSSLKSGAEQLENGCGHRTLIQALENAPSDADTLVTDYFPNLLEQLELLARLPDLRLRRIIFRQPSRTHGFFLSSNAHGRLDNLNAIGL